MALYQWPDLGVIITCEACDRVSNPDGGGCDLIVLDGEDGGVFYAHENDDCIAETARKHNLLKLAATDEDQ